VVSKSNAQSELQEVNNKLAALRKAVLMAGENLKEDKRKIRFDEDTCD
jgi:hypothetical protein